MPTVEEIQKLKQTIQTLERESAQTEAMLHQHEQKLAELGFPTLEDARDNLPGLRTRLEDDAKTLSDELARYWDDYDRQISRSPDGP